MGGFSPKRQLKGCAISPIIAQRNVVLFVGSEAQLVEAVVRLPGIRACWYALGTATKWGAGLAAGPSFDFSIG